MSEELQQSTALAVLETIKLPSAQKIGEDMSKSFSSMYAELESKIAGLDGDMSVAANRDAARSLAYKISQTKVAIVNSAKGSVEEFNSIVKAVTGERTKMEKEFDSLRDKARAKLTAWEEAKAIIDNRANEAIERLTDRSDDGKDAAELEMLIDNLQNWKINEELYGEHLERVTAAHLSAIEHLDRVLDKRRKYEQEQIELEQLRKEKAEREAAEAARIAEEERKRVEEVETARKAAERAEIERQAEAAAKKAAEEAVENAKREKEAAEQRAAEAEERQKQAEIDRQKADEERAERERRAEIDRQEQQKEAAARAEAAAKEREERAAAAERQRIENERLARERADQERAADLAHRKKINGEAVEAIGKLFAEDATPELIARAIVIAIYKGQIPHVAISY